MFDEITHVKVILVGDGTRTSIEDSLVYRVGRLETDGKEDNPGIKKPFWRSDIFLKIVDKTFSFGWKIALLAILGEKALSILPK